MITAIFNACPNRHLVGRVGKAKRAHHQDVRSAMDGGHGASAPLPTLRAPNAPWRRDFNFGLMLEKSISFWISSSS